MASIEEFFLDRERALQMGRAAARQFEASTTKGNAVEVLFKEFMQSSLPARLHLQAGEIIDRSGNRSGQVDCIISDTAKRGYSQGGQLLAPIESAVAAIEVKSTLDGGGLESAVRKIARIKGLVRGQHHGFYRSGDDHPLIDVPPRQTFGAIVAFGGLDLDRVIASLARHAEWYESDACALAPNLIVLVGRGFIHMMDGHICQAEGQPPACQFVRHGAKSGLRHLVEDVEALVDRYGSLTYEMEGYA